VVANSEYTKQQLAAALPAAVPISIVRCCAPVRSFAGDDATLTSIRNDRLNVVFVGQISVHKGVDLLVKAALALVEVYPSLDVIFAGPYDEHSTDVHTWRTHTEQLGYGDRLRFLGYVEDIPELMRHAFVHVMPSRCPESFGLVALEAKQQSVPSVVFPVGALSELICHKVDGYVCRDVSADTLVEGIRYFLDHPERRAAAGCEAARSATRYSVEQFEQAWVDVLTDNPSEPRPPEPSRQRHIAHHTSTLFMAASLAALRFVFPVSFLKRVDQLLRSSRILTLLKLPAA
jgi:glycosyltransferase involved in cell wall biosynthesis